MSDKIHIVAWYILNFRLLGKEFGNNVIDYDQSALSWIFIKNFTLPPVWRQTHSNLLLRFPGVSKYAEHDYFLSDQLFDHKNPFTPDAFYLNKGLVTRNGGITPHRILETEALNDLADKGYAKYCLKVIKWYPSGDVISGDNFLTFIAIIREKLKLNRSDIGGY